MKNLIQIIICKDSNQVLLKYLNFLNSKHRNDFLNDDQINELLNFECSWEVWMKKKKEMKKKQNGNNQKFSNAMEIQSSSPQIDMSNLDPASLVLLLNSPSFQFNEAKHEEVKNMLHEQEVITFTEEEKDILRHLPNKECNFYKFEEI